MATPTRQAAVLGILEGVRRRWARACRGARRRGRRDASRRSACPTGERRALTEPGQLLDGLGFAFWYPPQPVVVGELASGVPGGAGGTGAGDRIVAVDGEPVDDYLEVRRAHPRPCRRRPTRLVVLRGDGASSTRARAERGRARRAARSARSASAWSVATPGVPDSMTDLSSATVRSRPRSRRHARDLGQERAHRALPVAHGDRATCRSRTSRGPINIAQYAGLTADRGLHLLSWSSWPWFRSRSRF